MVDPSRCPIPPGFEVVGSFSDEFDHFKETTGYGDVGVIGRREYGFSNRWENSNIRSRDIVAGFQFKIGPKVGWRWIKSGVFGLFVQDNEKIRDSSSGDVNLHFPRVDPMTDDRGGYFMSIVWQEGYKTDDGLESYAFLGKEIPHNSYGKGNYFLTQYVPNPKPNIGQIKDGKWHSFLAVVYNDNSGHSYPTMMLWYNPNTTYDFSDFVFMGMGVDRGNMEPRGPLKTGVEDISPIFFEDHPFKIEHALQIRIDEIPTEQVEIRNAYAAKVICLLDPTPKHPLICAPEAKVVGEASVEVQRLEEYRRELKSQFADTNNEQLRRELESKIKSINDIHLPKAYTALENATIAYEKCRNQGPKEDVISGGGYIHPLTDIISAGNVSGLNTLNGGPFRHRTVSIGSSGRHRTERF